MTSLRDAAAKGICRALGAIVLVGMPLFVLPSAATANSCGGTDLRPSLSAQERARIAQAIDTAPFPHGNHWIAQKGERSVRVIGTLHTPGPRVDAVAQRLAPLLRDVDLLLVEVTDHEEQRMQAALANDPGIMMLTDTTLAEELDEELWQAVADAARERGIPAIMASKMQPWYLSLMLATPRCMLETIAHDEGKGLDAQLIERARAAEVPVRSLESYEDVLSLMSDAPFATQVSFLAASLVPDDVSEDLMETTMAAYFDEETALSWELARIMSARYLPLTEAELDAAFADFEARLLVQRNLSWMEVIDAAPESDIVLAVGALHLFGETGMLNQLQERGYALKRESF